MDAIRYASLDDEPVAHDVLRVFLKNHHTFVDCGSYTDAKTARIAFEAEPVDVLFLDIQLQDCTGLDFLRTLSRQPIATVLVTAHPEYALDAFALGVRDYLLKPVIQPRLDDCLSRLQPLIGHFRSRDVTSAPDRLAFPVGRSHAFRSPDEIIAIDADGNFSKLHLLSSDKTPPTELFVSESLKSLEDRLLPFGFVRCHKRHIVNTRYVSAVRASTVELCGQSERPLGRVFKQSMNLSINMNNK